MNYRMIVRQDEDGWVVQYPDLPNIIGSGKTTNEAIEEAQGNLEAYMAYLNEILYLFLDAVNEVKDYRRKGVDVKFLHL